MWWRTSQWSNFYYLTIHYALTVFAICLQTVLLCSSEKKEEYPNGERGLARTKVLSNEESKEEKEFGDVSTSVSKACSRGSAEEPANTGGKDPPKRVFPKRRRLRLNPDDSDSVKTEDTIYERRTKDRMESASASVRSLLRRRHEGLKVDRTQSLQRTLSQSAEDMAKSSSKEGVDQSESKAKNLLESVREWLNEQCTQRQMDSSEGNEPANSPKRRKSKRKKVSTLLPYQGIPVEHALPSDRLAREARSSTSLPKMESAEADSNAGFTDNDGTGMDSTGVSRKTRSKKDES